MITKGTKRSLIQQSRNVILIFLSLALLMIVSAVLELVQSKEELYQLMNEQAHALLESLITASRNTLLTNEYLEDLSEKRLLNNGNLIKKLYENGNLTNRILRKIAIENDIFRINIFNPRGQKIFSSHQPEHFNISENQAPENVLVPIFSGSIDTLIIGLKPARFKKGFRFAVAIAAKDRSAIVLNIDAQQLLNFKQHIGFGALLRNVVAENPRIIYAALQDTVNILAASGNVKVLEAISLSPFLINSLNDSLFNTRIVEFDSLEVFEAVHPFTHSDATIGLLRVGLSIEPIEAINDRIFRRLILITIVLIIIGSFMLTFIFTRQRFSILQKQYEVVETYSGNIINHVSDAIVVHDRVKGIKIFNTAAEKIFSIPKIKILGSSLDNLFEQSDYHKIIDEPSLLQQIKCTLGGQKKYLLISKSHFFDSEDNENIILVIRDLTDLKKLEEQMEREKRLTAMGELASGVAHEIRNPLNTIGTIIQQLNKDFEPANDTEEYHELAGLVTSEVKRINETIQEFLRFAKPEPINPRKIQIQPLFEKLKKQYHYLLKEHQIQLDLKLNWQGVVHWDDRQIQQVFLNLLQNAIEAIGRNGKISLILNKLDDQELEIQLKDDGPGMPEEVRTNIFNLYFTTKAKGTGIGLSIVQRIIYEHSGIITVESVPKKGTTFYIRLPIHFKTS